MRGVLLIAALVVFAVGCKKPTEKPANPTEPQMPTSTETGANTVACRVNSEVHIYKGVPTYLNADGVLFGLYPDRNEYFLQVTAGGIAEYKDNIWLLLYDTAVQLNTQYPFSVTETDKNRAEYSVEAGSYSKIYKTKGSSGFIKFTRYDKTVAAGTFEFAAYNDQGEKIEITEGFFDISRPQ
ncbi:DUF6252 family protein [Polluticoccus soli]|uniref:DUF6252 family protein n=1 Tax=Polluticoccus soli TaxID=3034150 RepID=UPI0023E22816|nr:DUF6252 family protein [Flavipsychrobacter sp. JY13-12]